MRERVMMMDVKKVLDEFIGSEISQSGSQEEQKLFVCELLLQEFKQMSAEEMLPFFRGMNLAKKERQVVVTLSFPVEFSPLNVS